MSIAKHTGYNVAGSLVPLLVSLVTVPLYLEAIGLERYGILALCWTILGYMGFVNLGLGPAVTQSTARFRRTDAEKISSVFWTALWLSLAMGLTGSLLLYGLANLYFANLRDVTTGLTTEIFAASGWLAAIVPVMMLSSVLTGALQGHERFLATNLISSSTTTTMAVIPLAIAYAFGPQLPGLIIGALGARVLSLLFLFLACRRVVPGAPPELPNLALVKPLLTFGGWVTATGFISPLVTTFDRFVIGYLLGTAAVSIYVVPHSLVSQLGLVPQALAGALFPRFANVETKRRETLLQDSVAALSSVQTPLVVLAIAVLGPFLHIWIGSEIAEQAEPIVYVLATGVWANGFARIPYAYLQASGRPDLITKLVLVYLLPYAGILYFGLSTLGLVGAALAWSLKGALDPLALFLLAGNARRNFASLALPAVLVYSTALTALAFPNDSWFRWSAFAILLAGACMYSARTMPAQMIARSKEFLTMIGSVARN